MFNRNKKAIVFVLILLISISSVSYLIPKTESIDPFFTLVAKALSPTHLDILYMIKEQIARIGINLDVIGQTFPYFVQDPPDYTIFRDYDLAILEFSNETNVMYFDSLRNDPFFSDLYSENGSIETLGYESSYDWDEELEFGRNEWYIQSGLEMISNGSQNQKEFCWEWQFYLMDDILPCLPLFTHKNDSSSLQLLVFNLKEVRPVIGSRHPCPGFPTKSIGLGIKKAISFAINREEIKRVLLGDDYEVTHHPVNPLNKNWLNPDIFKFCHNLVVAQNYMSVTGYGLCGMPFEGGYGPWPDWEDVCGESLSTISVTNYGFRITIISVVLISIISSFKLRKKRNLGGK